MTYHDYYDGSKIFSGLSNKIGLPVDIVSSLIFITLTPFNFLWHISSCQYEILLY